MDKCTAILAIFLFGDTIQACDVLIRGNPAEQQKFSSAIKVETVHEGVHLLQANDKATVYDDETEVIEMCFGSGTHSLGGEVWALSETTRPNVVWKPAGASAPPVKISGGQLLNKWHPCNKDGRCPWSDWEGVWVHYLANGDVPGRNASSSLVRNFWVNGERISRQSVNGSILGDATPTTNGFQLNGPLPQELEGRVSYLC